MNPEQVNEVIKATDEIDEAIEKANRLVELLREASSLASSLGGRVLIDPVEGFNP